MPPSSIQTVSLVCHAEARGSPVKTIEARVGRAPGDTLAIAYLMHADFGRVRVPAPSATPGVEHGLWQHTCFEVFVKRDGEVSYHELNFSPSGAWAAYAFDRYRHATPAEQMPDPHVTVQRGRGKLELRAAVPLRAISPLHENAGLRLGLSAVIEDEEGTLSYWALRHPPGRPDFHHACAFALALE